MKNKGELEFENYDVNQLQSKMACGNRIMQHFTVPELKTILVAKKCTKTLTGLKKASLVCLVSEIFGDGSAPESSRGKNPETLKRLVEKKTYHPGQSKL